MFLNMTLQEAKIIFEKYQDNLDKSIRRGYEIAAPISLLWNYKDEIKQAIKTIYIHIINTTKATPDDLEILNFGYQNLATFIDDTDAGLILEAQNKLKAIKEQTPENFRKILVKEKDSVIANLEKFVEIQKNIQKEQRELACEFEQLASQYRITRENKGRVLGRKLGYNTAMLSHLVTTKIKNIISKII